MALLLVAVAVTGATIGLQNVHALPHGGHAAREWQVAPVVLAVVAVKAAAVATIIISSRGSTATIFY